MITWLIWTPMSSARKIADKLNPSLSLSLPPSLPPPLSLSPPSLSHGTKRIWVIHSWPWYWLAWPWWGGWMYRIVTGVTSDVGVPSTYLVVGPLATDFTETLIKFYAFPFKKMHLKMSSGKWRPFYLCLNVLLNSVGVRFISIKIMACHLVSTKLHVIQIFRNNLDWNLDTSTIIFIQKMNMKIMFAKWLPFNLSLC